MSASDPTLASAEAASTKASFLTLFPSIMLPMFLAVIDQTIVAAALPSIVGDLHSVERTAGVVVAYLMAAATLSPVYGRLGDAFGRRRLLLVAIAVFVAASVLCALARSIEMLILARLLQGVGGGGLMTLSQALIGETVPPRDRARYQGYIAAIAVSSNTLGPVVGGYLAEHFGWQSIFLVNVPLGFLAGLLVRRLPIRQREQESFRFDTPGLLLFALTVATLLSALQELQRFNRDDVTWIATLALVGAISAILLIWREGRAVHPLIPLGVLRNPSIWRCDLMALCHGAMLVSLLTYLPIYYRVVHGSSATEIGLLILPMTLTIGFSSMITGRIVGRTGRTALLPSWGLVLTALTLASLAYASPLLTSTQVSATLALNSLFMGTVMGVVQVVVQTAAGPRFLGIAASTVQLSRALGAAIGTAVVGLVLFAVITSTSPEAIQAFALVLQRGPDALGSLPSDSRTAVEAGFGTAFRAVFLTISIFALASSALSWTLPLRRI